jgi:hypothetical protein
MTNQKRFITALAFCLSLPGLVAGAEATDQVPVQASPESADSEAMDRLTADVLALGLGEGDYVIGAPLTEAQAVEARKNLMADAYPGTIQFPGGDFVVVAEEKTNLVLAVYQRREDVGADEVRQMVGGLMTRFGEPTTMAHEKLIYWAFGSQGKIDQEAYDQAKAVGEIEILATVKFNSTIGVSPGMDSENTAETGVIYYIITSEPLLKMFVSRP